MHITLQHLYERFSTPLCLTVLGPREALAHELADPRIAEAGLSLLGHFDDHPGDRIAIFGSAEFRYFGSLDAAARIAAIARIANHRTIALIVTDLDPTTPAESLPALVAACATSSIAVLRAEVPPDVVRHELQVFLEQRLPPRLRVHGVLVDVLGVGILITGKSSIGKSECALDLVQRGHRFIADDVVEITRYRGGAIAGRCSNVLGHHMEIRGLGIIDIRELYGASAVRRLKRIEMVVNLVEWNPGTEYDRLGVTNREHAILDVRLPLVEVPVSPGRNVASLIEVIARNQLLKGQGHHTAHRFQQQLADRIRKTSDLVAPVDTDPAQVSQPEARA